MDLKDKRVLVVGLGQTGIAVSHFCVERGAKVIVTDAKGEDTLGDRIAKLPKSVSLELGGHQLSAPLRRARRRDHRQLLPEALGHRPGDPPTPPTAL